MYKKIYKKIKQYKNIVITRHIGVDPDAMASSMALKEAIELTFKDKNVYAIGNGTVRFNYIGKLDKIKDPLDEEDTLLIVLDTPDKKRVDFGEYKDFLKYKESIKIDHHIYIETFCDIELIDEKKSSASEMVYDLIKNTNFKYNKSVAEKILYGIIADTNRFLFSSNPNTFYLVSDLLSSFDIDLTKVYQKMYMKPFNEIKLHAYMTMNMKITDYGVGYIKLTNEAINKLQIDSPSLGDSINDFNYIDELLVWLSANEDIKNNCIRISIRSRGPAINKIAEKYNGGGHLLACGARVYSFEEVDLMIDELNKLCKSYIESSDINED